MTARCTVRKAAGKLAVLLFCCQASIAGAEQIDAIDLYELPAADVYFLGEVHDNPVHHAHQAIALQELGVKAVVYEMLTDTQAGLVRPNLIASEKALSAVLEWEASGWPDFAMYYPLFVASAEAKVLGGALDRDVVRSAVSEGAAAAFGEGAEVFGLHLPLPADEASRRQAGQADAHCGALPEEMLSGMVEAQRVRDAALARAVLTAFTLIGGPVAVITGNGHARKDWGAPRMLTKALPDVRIMALGQFESDPGPEPPFDFWILTDATERGDPCAIFRNR